MIFKLRLFYTLHRRYWVTASQLKIWQLRIKPDGQNMLYVTDFSTPCELYTSYNFNAIIQLIWPTYIVWSVFKFKHNGPIWVNMGPVWLTKCKCQIIGYHGSINIDLSVIVRTVHSLIRCFIRCFVVFVCRLFMWTVFGCNKAKRWHIYLYMWNICLKMCPADQTCPLRAMRRTECKARLTEKQHVSDTRNSKIKLSRLVRQKSVTDLTKIRPVLLEKGWFGQKKRNTSTGSMVCLT